MKRAQSYEGVCIAFSVLVTSLLLLGFTICADPLARLFTNDEEIAERTKSSFWSLFLYVLFSTVKGVQNGVVRALG